MRLFALLLLISVCRANDRKFSEDLNQACIIRFMQIRGKMNDNFLKVEAPSDVCRILLPLVYANHSEKLCLRLWEAKTVKANCVFDKLKNSDYIDLELKYEIYSATVTLNRNVRRKRMWEIQRDQRLLLEEVARECKSDPDFGGAFDHILGINSSLAVVEQNYCILQYTMNNGFLDLPKEHLNPLNLTRTTIDCVSIIQRLGSEKKKSLLEAFRRRKYSNEAITCLLDKYHDERIFGWNLAKDIVNRINLSDNLRRSEDLRLSRILADFSRTSTNCLYSFNWELFQ